MSLQSETLSEKLLPDEYNKSMMNIPAITTITWFKGRRLEATAALRRRLVEVLEANPWAAGRLVWRGNEVFVEYNKTIDDGVVERFFNPQSREGKVRAPLDISSSMSHAKLCLLITGSAAEVPTGKACVDRGEPLVALSVVPDAVRPDEGFGVIWSVSHCLADGWTYYKLLSMFSSNGSVTPMNVSRRQEFSKEGFAATGEEGGAYLRSMTFLLNVIWGMFGREPSVFSYYLDPSRVKDAKAAAMSAADDPHLSFVSTNDVVVSAFARASRLRLLLMPINLRGRLTNYAPSDAGNYDSCFLLAPTDFATPLMIRGMLASGPPFQRGGGGAGQPGAFPGLLEGLSCRMGVVTNWLFACFEEVVLEGCDQEVHLPLSNNNACPFDIAIVYRPHRGVAAVAFFVRTSEASVLHSELPLGREVSWSGTTSRA
eukprot:Hpha_TRINITY_DN19863_c0_g1::TRINITY_DN19863_c0_g1_i1::g.132055::m.132055